ncbi:hypothetical protein JCM8547_008002 [Rhodosporidiobolus lusitaniae]
MAVLPPELLTEIGTYLVLDVEDRKRAHTALCHLCRMSKVYRDIFTPLLFSKAILRESKQLSSWAKAVKSAVAAPVEEGGSMNKLEAQAVKPKKLIIILPVEKVHEYHEDYPDPFPPPASPDPYNFSYKRVEAPALPKLKAPLESGLFQHLKLLRLVNVFASHKFLAILLAPGTTTRSNIKLLALYSTAKKRDFVIPETELLFLLEAL